MTGLLHFLVVTFILGLTGLVGYLFAVWVVCPIDDTDEHHVDQRVGRWT